MTRNTITLPRSVLEQALEALNASMPHNNDMAEDWPSHIAARRALRAALEQPQDHFPNAGNRVPTGWKLVPVEPTKDMKAAGAFAAMDQVRRSYNPPSAYIPVDSMALLSYRAMIAAAPQPPTTEQSSAVQPQVEQEPVAWIENIGGGIGYNPYHDAARKLPDGVRFDLYTHPQNLNCKSNQARLATLWGYIKEQPQQEQEWKRRLGNLLAVIHGDGGHYIEAHGWDKAQADAEERVARVMTGLPQSASVVWPRTASEMRAFLSGHVAAERYARDDHQPDDSDTYTLSAHDLLGAIDWWTDCAQRPRQPLTEEQILNFGPGQPDAVWSYEDQLYFARAIERAHGIGGEA